MKRYILLAAVTATISGNVFSQKHAGGNCPMMKDASGGCPAMSKGRGVREGRREMMQMLDLSQSQKDQLKSLREERQSKIQQIENNDNVTLKEYRSRKAALAKEYKGKMESVLTEEQKNKMKTARENRKAETEKKSETRLQSMRTHLSLNDNQYAQLSDARKTMQVRMASIRANESLSPEQKKQQMMILRQDNKMLIEKTLTPQQLEKMKEIRKAHQGANRFMSRNSTR